METLPPPPPDDDAADAPAPPSSPETPEAEAPNEANAQAAPTQGRGREVLQSDDLPGTGPLEEPAAPQEPAEASPGPDHSGPTAQPAQRHASPARPHEPQEPREPPVPAPPVETRARGISASAGAALASHAAADAAGVVAAAVASAALGVVSLPFLYVGCLLALFGCLPPVFPAVLGAYCTVGNVVATLMGALAGAAGGLAGGAMAWLAGTAAGERRSPLMWALLAASAPVLTGTLLGLVWNAAWTSGGVALMLLASQYLVQSTTSNGSTSSTPTRNSGRNAVVAEWLSIAGVTVFAAALAGMLLMQAGGQVAGVIAATVVVARVGRPTTAEEGRVSFDWFAVAPPAPYGGFEDLPADDSWTRDEPAARPRARRRAPQAQPPRARPPPRRRSKPEQPQPQQPFVGDPSVPPPLEVDPAPPANVPANPAY